MKNPTTDLDELHTRPQTAAFLKVSLRHLDLVTARGLIPHIRVGRAIRYVLPDVLAALKRSAPKY